MEQDIAVVHRRAEDIFERTLLAVPDDGWDQPSACANWTIRDVVAHAVWGRELIRASALGDELEDRTAAPGSAHPGNFLHGDPRAAFRTARTECDAALTDEALRMPAPAFARRGWPEATVGDFLLNLVSDLIIHNWDIASRIGAEIEDDERTLAVAVAAASHGVTRSAAFFADELTPPADANPFEALLAFMGRDPRATGGEA